MPNIGAPELVLVFWILVPVGIGYWCLLVFRRKGKSSTAGFALGFLLTLFLSLIGAITALLIAYLSRPSGVTPVGGGSPVPPPAASPEARVIATFGPSTGWHGKRIVYQDGVLLIDGVGTVSLKAVQSYAKKGQIEWESPAMQSWVADRLKYT
jgi:hypothetical protein